MAKRRPSGDGMVRKRDDGRWEGRIVVGHKNNGEPIYKYILVKTQSELIQKLHDKIEMYRNADLSEDYNMQLSEWLDKWLNEYIVCYVRPNTLHNYTAMIKNQINPYLGKHPLSALTTQEIQKFYNTIKKKGRVKIDKTHHSTELADSMVRSVHMLLHKALDMAVKQKLIISNPTNGTTIPKNNYAPKQILNDEQLNRFMVAIKDDVKWYDFFYTEITTGLRKGEICGLKWEDFDERYGTLKINRSIGKNKNGVSIGKTKTETGLREILLPPSTAELLRKRKINSISKWIFPNFRNAEKPISPECAYNRLKTLLKEAGLPSIRFHDLRHTFATHAIAGGVDAKTLSAILGHANASFTLDTYTHITTDMQKNAASIVGNFIDNIIGGVENG